MGCSSSRHQPLQPRPRGKFSSGGKTPAGEAQLPRLSVADFELMSADKSAGLTHYQSVRRALADAIMGLPPGGSTQRPQQCLNFLPLPHGHGSLRPTFRGATG